MTTPAQSPMGNLRVAEVFVEYDGPRLFLAENDRREQFLANFVEESEHEEIYLFVRLSELRVKAVRSGQVSLRHAYTFPEPDAHTLFVYRQRSDGGDDGPVEQISYVDVPDAWLPEERLSLDISTPTAREFFPGDLAREAVAYLRPTAAFEFESTETTTEFPLRPMGSLLSAIQENVEALAQEATGKPTTRGLLPQEVLAATELMFSGVRAASFVVLVTPRSGGLFPSPLIAQALARLQGLMEVATDAAMLTQALSSLKPRALSKYRDLLEQVEEVGIGFKVLVSDVTGDVRSTELNIEQVRLSLKVARGPGDSETETLNVEGVLIGVNARTYVFEIFDDVTNKKMSGKMIDAAKSKALGLTTGQRYTATLIKQTEYEALTSEIKFKYRMSDIEPA